MAVKAAAPLSVRFHRLLVAVRGPRVSVLVVGREVQVVAAQVPTLAARPQAVREAAVEQALVGEHHMVVAAAAVPGP
jgi:hypothetical protein